MKRHLHQSNQRITAAVLNRQSTLIEQEVFDEIMRRLLVAPAGGRLAQGTSGYISSDCQVSYTSGNRQTGVTFTVAAGLGFKNIGSVETDPALATFKPVKVDSSFTFVTAPSDPSNPRWDRVYMKPATADQNAISVDVIDPATKNITSSGLSQDRAWSFAFAYVSGTAAVTPTAPAAPSGFVDADCIADILIAPGSGAFNPTGANSFTVTNLHDIRSVLVIEPSAVPAAAAPAASVVTVSPAVGGQTNVQASLTDLDARVTATSQTGLLIGSFDYVNTQSVKLSRGLAGAIRIEIDGVDLVQTASDLTFDLTVSLDTGSEAASTWYYCYVENVGGVLTPHISTAAPVLAAASGKVGYHPTHTGWRYVGPFRNDASSNVDPFVSAGGWINFYQHAAYRFFGLGTVVPTAWTLQAVSAPTPAKSFRMAADGATQGAKIAFGASNAPGTLPTTVAEWSFDGAGLEGAIALCGTSDTSATAPERHNYEFVLPIADRTAPGFKWGVVKLQTSGSIGLNNARINGFFDPLMARS